jgi:hypothetical protein
MPVGLSLGRCRRAEEATVSREYHCIHPSGCDRASNFFLIFGSYAINGTKDQLSQRDLDDGCCAGYEDPAYLTFNSGVTPARYTHPFAVQHSQPILHV